MRLIHLLWVLTFTTGSLQLRADPSLPAEYRFSIAHMDKSAKPGEDFYHYACGSWLKTNKIPEDRASWGPSDHLTELNLLRLKEICESAAQSGERGPAQRLVGDFYASALDETKRETLAFKPLEPDMSRINAADGPAALSAIAADLQNRNISVLFGSYVDADSRQSDRYALHFFQAGLALPDRDYYLSEDFAKERKLYSAHLRKMFALLGEAPEQAQKSAAAVVRLETALAKASKPAEDLNDAIANYHKFSTAELPAKAPGIDWPAYWKALGAEPKYVVVGQPEFLAKAGRLLASEPMDEWKAYFRWQVLTSGAPLLHRAADAEDFGFFGTVLEGRQQQSPLWKRAILMVDGKIGDALGQAYAARYFPPAAKARMQEMVANIKTAYAGRIKTTAWMSPETRNRALEKLEKFRAKLGYPDKWKDYASLEIRRDDYYGNVQRSQLWESRRQLGRIGQPVDRDEWSMTPPTVNAYFNQNNNEIVFPAGILQPPFFDLAMDDAVNYGATGATIGHELTHGFDSEGRKFDSQGNLNDWWTKADSKEFERRAQRLVDQFSKLDGLPGLKVNGKLTLPENIADLGGVILAYEALQTSLAADPSKRRSIDGLTPEQRFFISYAQSWVQLSREERLRQLITRDSHAPDHLRAVAPLQNFQAFYDAFGIQAGAKLWLAPEKRSVIW